MEVERFICQAEEWGDLWNMMLAWYEGCLTARCMGKLGLAEEYYKKAMRELSARGVSGFGSSCKVHGNYAELLYEENELNRIEELLDGYVDGYEDWLLPTDLLVGFSPLIKTRIATGNVEGARDLLKRAEKIEAQSGIFPRIRVLFRNLRIRYSIAAGNPKEYPALYFPPELVSEALHLEAGTLRYLIAAGRSGEASIRAAALAPKSFATGDVALYIEVKALQALAMERSGAEYEALTALGDALKAAGNQPYIRTFVDLGDPIRSLLVQLNADPSRLPETGEAIARILSAFRLEKARVPRLHGEAVSPREREVLDLLAEGASNREIADVLCVSESTVKTHIHHLAEKLDAKSRGAIVQRARLAGLLTDKR